MKKILYWLMLKTLRMYATYEEKVVNEWLLAQSSQQGFKQYFKQRDWAILKEMAQGVKQEEYWKLVGQRHELLTFLGLVCNAQDLAERKKKKKS